MLKYIYTYTEKDVIKLG